MLERTSGSDSVVMTSRGNSPGLLRSVCIAAVIVLAVFIFLEAANRYWGASVAIAAAIFLLVTAVLGLWWLRQRP